jgi:hypothetical protein
MSKELKNLRLVEINTTAFDEENLLIVTNLTDGQIKKVIRPIVMSERIGDDFYNNDELLTALLNAYPDKTIVVASPEKIII